MIPLLYIKIFHFLYIWVLTFTFEKLYFESEIYFKLQEAEREAELTDKRFSSKDILNDMKAVFRGDDVV